MTHNKEHIEHCKARLLDRLAQWRREHLGQGFTIQQVVADLTEDQRSVYVLVHSEEGDHFQFRAVFDEVLFDCDAFTRKEWSRTLLIAAREASA